MNKKKVLALFLALAMVVICFTACAQTTTSSSAPASSEAPATSSETPATTSEEPATSSETPATGAEIEGLGYTAEWAAEQLYAQLPNTCLAGWQNPNTLADRTDEAKGLPFKPKDPEHIVVGWTEQTQGDPWFVSVKDGAEEAAKKYGMELSFDIADFDLQTQSSHMDSYISRGVDIIVIDPCDVLGVAADIQRAVEAGIPVIGFGSDIYGAPLVTAINANISAVGYSAGYYTGKQFKADEQINMGIILGVMGNTTAESRVCGMMTGIIAARAELMGLDITRQVAAWEAYNLFQELKTSGKFSSDFWKMACLGWGEGSWTYEGGLQQAEPILAANQDKLNLLIGENDFQGLGAATAVANYGLQDQIKIACPGNGMKSELEKVKDGTLLCDGPHPGYQYALTAMKFIYDLAHEHTWDENNLPLSQYFPSFCLNNDTMATYWDDSETNPYFKTPELQIQTIPEVKAALEDGSYWNEWVPSN